MWTKGGKARRWASPFSVEASSIRRRRGRGSEEVRLGVPGGAVTIVRQTGRPIVDVARKLGIGPGTFGNWVHKDRLARGEELDHAKAGPAYVRRLERELAEVRMERDLPGARWSCG
jgi:transposase-like protein